MADSRQEFLLEVVEVAKLKGLEIGPLNKPLVKREDIYAGGEIFYLDHLPTDELRQKYKNDKSVSVDEIVPVDFVCREGDIINATSGNMFDYVVASHVIEHTPNLLHFLNSIHSILNPGGLCIFIIPDKRFTFDINRPLTTFGEVLEKFVFEVKKPNVSEVYDHFAMATHANGHNLWNGITDKKDTRSLVSKEFAWKAAHRVFEKQKYYDVHVNVFTPESFFSILRKSIEHEIILFEVESFRDTDIGQIEFMVVLKKPMNGAMASCLKTLPIFELGSLLSPYMPQVKALSSALERTTKIALDVKAELDQVNLNSKKEIERLQSELQTTQKVLDRRSVKLVLLLMDKFFNILKSNK